MTALLKANDDLAQRKVRKFGQVDGRVAGPVREAVLQITDAAKTTEDAVEGQAEGQSEAIQLERQISQLRAQIEQAEADAEKRIKDAFERGMEQGRQMALLLDQEKLDLMREMISAANEQFAERTDSMQILSLQVAQLAMAKILGDKNRYAELVSDSIRYRCSQLSKELIVAIRVSPDDFPDAAALDALCNQTGRHAIMIDSSLQTGSCEIDLKLGRLDAGIATQWDRARHFLDSLSEEGVLS